ncbi:MULTISPECIES: type III secretion system inner membrane ring lipoprotein SctJ [Proteus]|uniref:type III secretion system inner membrane ring lipoprotein SctJ n=1 Tax=Proteus TaxID=583 RepID=UPI000BFB7249|nr:MULTISPECIES: type III secretion inner membrane ring lipoprotein SctJ [Proteus]ATM99325.1 EscJ/YscJ/HrcJ family type III secretion inner membrane ring protein [Proteus vulgaris]MBG2837683.1 type III secretion inner membrane ring lipoprotein SctJ [Proteus terrae subsp. cibarius]MBG2868054.1 type III secretion inner membrane ring lipoprotein SctJ [Proteus terrae subsp. cibarius]MBJ2110021.1 type III secretion inner membrane ring lipoprotein SctJ [Proteus terrae]MBJ2133949.1 type III secretion
MKMRCLLLALLCCLFPLLSGCKDQSLLTNLDQRQATEIQAVLQKHQITSTRKALGKGLFDVSVKKEDMGIAIQILEEYQLPTLSRIEVTQLFPSDALVSSPQAEKARLISAIEQRLEQSLLTIDHIIDARVHVSYPISPTERIVPTPHASALVFYEEGMLDNNQLTDDVRAFIHNAFNDMNEDNITVLSYPRNINKFNMINNQSYQNNSDSFFNSWLFLSLVLAVIVAIITVSLIIFRRKKTLKEENNDKSDV